MAKKFINNDGIKFDSEGDLKEYEATREANKRRIQRVTGGKVVDFTEKRRAKTDAQKFIIEDILPEGEVHLLGGSSGVGKSTLLLPVLKNIQEGKPVWGLKTIATPLVYIMCDSSSTSLERKLRRIGLHDWHIPAYAIEDLRQQPFDMIYSETEIWDLPDIFPWAKLFVIESFGWFYRDGANSGTRDYSEKMRFWGRVRAAYSDRNLTILGTTHMPKFKKGEQYENPRDRFFGSTAQTASMSTGMLLEKDEEDVNRTLMIMPRDCKNFTLEFGVDGNGVLQYLGRQEDRKHKEEVREQTSMRMFDAKLGSYRDGETLTSTTITEWYQSMNFSRATVNRWLSVRVKDGTLTRIEFGVYKVAKHTEQ